jgi:secondary thiamine-phosphate synthase enzyme
MKTVRVRLPQTRELELVDVTPMVQAEVTASEVDEGLVLVFVPGSTAAVTTIEFEPGLREDFPRFLERLAPRGRPYAHDLTWHDGNGHSHVRASLLGPSLCVPFQAGKLLLGTWQQIVMVELDTKTRRRDLIIQIAGG